MRSSVTHGIINSTLTGFQLHDDTYRLFLYPAAHPPRRALVMNDIQARLWGWLDIEPGGLKIHDGKKLLLMSHIVGEDFAIETVHPSRFVKWILKSTRHELSNGVWGCNIHTQQRSHYRDIRYTKRANELYRTGVAWKQLLDDNVVFEPASLHS